MSDEGSPFDNQSKEASSFQGAQTSLSFRAARHFYNVISSDNWSITCTLKSLCEGVAESAMLCHSARAFKLVKKKHQCC
jgi:hypothetical protein